MISDYLKKFMENPYEFDKFNKNKISKIQKIRIKENFKNHM